MTACAHANEDASLPGGGRRQEPHPANVGPAPPAVREHQLAATSAAYRERAFAHGIPFRPSGLFPPGDPLLARLAADARLRPFEKHLPADASSYQSLPAGGWASGDAAAARGMDLRLFWRPPAAGEAHGTLAGAVRFGDGAGIGTDVWMPAHGGSIETSLDEATAELAKCEFTPIVSTREATFHLLKPVPLHTSLVVEAKIKEVRGIRCYVEGTLRAPGAAEGVGERPGAVLASCTALLINVKDFI